MAEPNENEVQKWLKQQLRNVSPSLCSATALSDFRPESPFGRDLGLQSIRQLAYREENMGGAMPDGFARVSSLTTRHMGCLPEYGRAT